MKYILIVFDRGVGYPEEFSILHSVLKEDQDSIAAAQCGPINISQFASDFTRDEISKILKEKGIEFMLMEEDHSTSSFPKKLSEHFSGKPSEISRDTKVKKRPLKELLDEALAKEEYEIASGIKRLMDEGHS